MIEVQAMIQFQENQFVVYILFMFDGIGELAYFIKNKL